MHGPARGNPGCGSTLAPARHGWQKGYEARKTFLIGAPPAFGIPDKMPNPKRPESFPLVPTGKTRDSPTAFVLPNAVAYFLSRRRRDLESLRPSRNGHNAKHNQHGHGVYQGEAGFHFLECWKAGCGVVGGGAHRPNKAYRAYRSYGAHMACWPLRGLTFPTQTESSRPVLLRQPWQRGLPGCKQSRSGRRLLSPYSPRVPWPEDSAQLPPR